jgi:hypothetical protein
MRLKCTPMGLTQKQVGELRVADGEMARPAHVAAIAAEQAIGGGPAPQLNSPVRAWRPRVVESATIKTDDPEAPELDKVAPDNTFDRRGPRVWI